MNYGNILKYVGVFWQSRYALIKMVSSDRGAH